MDPFPNNQSAVSNRTRHCDDGNVSLWVMYEPTTHDLFSGMERRKLHDFILDVNIENKVFFA
jgi:hypothetical protein